MIRVADALALLNSQHNIVRLTDEVREGVVPGCLCASGHRDRICASFQDLNSAFEYRHASEGNEHHDADYGFHTILVVRDDGHQIYK